MRRPEPPAMRLDDLAQQLGPRLAQIRAALDTEADIAVVMADRVSDGDACVLVATRSSVHVSCRRPADQSQGTERSSWSDVRVSPMRLEGWSAISTGAADPARYGCEVLVGDARFLVSTDGTAERPGIEAFHDEVVRRGTPWHFPRSGSGARP